MKDVPADEVTRERQVSVLIDGEVPGNFPEETVRGEKEDEDDRYDVQDVL